MSEQRSPAGQVMTRLESFEWGDTAPVSGLAPASRPQSTGPAADTPVSTRPTPAERLAEFVMDRSRKGYLLKGLALAGVALISGTLWSAVQNPRVTGIAMVSPEAPSFFYEQHALVRDSDCAKRSYGSQVPPFFRKTPCQGLVRWLFASKAKDGAPVVVALAVVKMASTQDAVELERLTNANDTGNINDLVREGHNVPGGPDKFKKAGYASAVEGSSVLIAESEFYDDDREDVPMLQEISKDALRLARSIS